VVKVWLNRMETLEILKAQTVKPKVICNPGPYCWCAQIAHVVDIPSDDAVCYSPEQILDKFGDELTISERQYLETLM